jgi:mono/diheme cytochrome c family protein
MRTLARLVWHGLAVLGLLALAAGVALWYSGIGTRTPPSTLEAGAARLLRRTMIPASARLRVNPEPSTPESVREGMAHWADHCALCHANDGSGATPIGQALYPPAPDMRQDATQRLTDGELFYIIENGVKMTGMPAWGTGTPDGERSPC